MNEGTPSFILLHKTRDEVHYIMRFTTDRPHIMPTNPTLHPCPCCGYEVFSRPPGSFEICPICFWEDDDVQLAFPDLPGGANQCSLIDAQRHYERLGACEPQSKPHVRPPEATDSRTPGWRPLDPTRDRYLKWSNAADRDLWDSIRADPNRCDYYWLSDYWLAHP